MVNPSDRVYVNVAVPENPLAGVYTTRSVGAVVFPLAGMATPPMVVSDPEVGVDSRDRYSAVLESAYVTWEEASRVTAVWYDVLPEKLVTTGVSGMYTSLYVSVPDLKAATVIALVSNTVFAVRNRYPVSEVW